MDEKLHEWLDLTPRPLTAHELAIARQWAEELVAEFERLYDIQETPRPGYTPLDADD